MTVTLYNMTGQVQTLVVGLAGGKQPGKNGDLTLLISMG